ncbi:peptidyl-prolyl cis-trans isomerase, rhodopsin-specific isozyme-like isoform X2 [Anthonomus grandis grandis]|uniref:peptidyl-prolyl cis-trans isomerase, rhodopsin-specific isozyme-like isoform X2 n=1 Tax=Anthonomus grandis grandis TaxID=2921223 RepID=UPI00216508DA|nr:peptidyl-prolyl cis-trans isomerase, rhodopsin-specific isozyme-like isoform X2 [Anthonomus grandis grandis]
MYNIYVIFNVCFILIASLITDRINAENYKITDQIFMDVKIEDDYTGRIIFGLFGEVAPKTVKNFKHIALQGIDGKRYVGTNFIIAIKRVMIQGGDILYNNGSGSISIYGEHFEDETFEVKPDSGGLLAMVNDGVPNTNGCMFFITTMPAPWLEGKYVIFGKVLRGHEVVHKIEQLKTDYSDRLKSNVQIIKCGQISFTPFYEDHKNYEITIWAWIKAGWFPLSFSFAILAFFHYLLNKLNSLQHNKYE